MLENGAWQHETWTPENLRLYLDVVHAWNCAINRGIAPQAGTLYESRGDLPLSRYERSVTNTVGWIRSGPMPVSALSDRIRRSLSWDPLDADWDHISSLARGTRESAKRLQAALSNPDGDERAAALEDHASRISERLVGIPITEVSPWVWWVAKAYGGATGSFESELVNVAEEAARDIPFVYSTFHRKLVVNTIKSAEAALL